MEGQAKILWDFMETAFRTGALDEMLGLAQAAAGGKYENQYDNFEQLEDYFLGLEGLAPLEVLFDRMFTLLKAITDEQALEGLGVLSSLITPWVARFVSEHGTDHLAERASEIKGAVAAVSGVVINAALDSVTGEHSHACGVRLGRLVNQLAAFINGLLERDDQALVRFLSGVAGTVDREEAGKMVQGLQEAFLVEKPFLARASLNTVFLLLRIVSGVPRVRKE